MKIVYKALILFVLISLFEKCASPQRPEGGPRDTIPPTLIYANPAQGTKNFNDQVIILEFDEYVKSDKLKQNLIITPTTKIKYKVIPRKTSVKIKLEEPLAISTTYNFNFFKGITDATENNPAVNLSLAFSTGPTIDSMQISGTVIDHLKETKTKGMMVGLYPISDSLDFLAHSPQYFSTTLDSGDFNISYVKQGNYRILAFEDKNSNLILDPQEEPHGFIADTIQLDSAISNIELRTILQDVRPLEIINARGIAQYAEVTFNRDVDSYQLTPDSTISNIIGKERDLIRIYNTGYGKDSVEFILQATDSLNNQATDTFKIRFLETSRKPATLTSEINFKYGMDTSQLSFDFSKPMTIEKDYLIVKADTAYVDSIFTINPEGEYFTSGTTLIPVPFDTLLSNYYGYLLELDTNKLDSILPRKPLLRDIQVDLPKGYFISIEGDTTKAQNLKLVPPKELKTGTLNLNVSGETGTPYWLQLIQKNKVAYTLINNETNNYSLELAAGQYTIRILYDLDEDGKWSYGNLILGKEPEPLQLFPENIAVRENWVIDLDLVLKL